MRPLEGRRFWFVGIGGAGMSALALVAHAWGAKVGGSDRERSSYVERLEAAGVAGDDRRTGPRTCRRTPRSSSPARSLRTTLK